mmetsp:Transcript_71627/g.226240  ORF Transcript_71627/g.226240 Transcript_71627/m.226240 type:complete len:325 (+) Transcript_71627:158-1132(+)
MYNRNQLSPLDYLDSRLRLSLLRYVSFAGPSRQRPRFFSSGVPQRGCELVVGRLQVEHELPLLVLAELVARRHLVEARHPLADLHLTLKVWGQLQHLALRCDHVAEQRVDLVHRAHVELQRVHGRDHVLHRLRDARRRRCLLPRRPVLQGGGHPRVHQARNGVRALHVVRVDKPQHVRHCVLQGDAQGLVLGDQLLARRLILLVADGVAHVHPLQLLRGLDDGEEVGRVIVNLPLLLVLPQFQLTELPFTSSVGLHRPSGGLTPLPSPSPSPLPLAAVAALGAAFTAAAAAGLDLSAFGVSPIAAMRASFSCTNSLASSGVTCS